MTASKIIYFREDPHLILDYAFSRLRFDGNDFVLIKSPLRRISSSFWLIRAIIVTCSSVAMTAQALFEILKSRRIVVFREYWVLLCFLAIFFLFPFRGRVVFNVNHNLQQGVRNDFVPERFLVKVGFNVLIFDGENVANILFGSDGERILTAPFPAPHEPNFNNCCGIRSRRPIVGIVGDFRSEKIKPEMLNYVLESIKKLVEVEIVVGARDIDAAKESFNGVDRFICTRSRERYIEFLSGLDLLIVFGAKESYYFRHSGTLMDAIYNGVIVLAPNYPIVSQQIANPVRVGLTYDEVTEIPETVKIGIGMLGQRETLFPEYWHFRSSVSIGIR